MKDLYRLVGEAPTWGVWSIGSQLSVGPVRRFTEGEPNQTVSVVEFDASPQRTLLTTMHVRENASQFDVSYYRFDGYRGLWHGGGHNWIFWTDDERNFFVSRGAGSWDRTWVHVRYLLRHFIVGHYVSRRGYRRIHAVVGALPTEMGGGGLVVAGPFQSGKTYLLNELLQRGLVEACLEDDCAVLDPQWNAHCLLPEEHCEKHSRTVRVRAVVCLDPSATSFTPIEPRSAAAWIYPVQASWPVPWMPGAPTPNTEVESVPADLPCIRCPATPPVRDAVDAIEHILHDLGH